MMAVKKNPQLALFGSKLAHIPKAVIGFHIRAQTRVSEFVGPHQPITKRRARRVPDGL